MRYILIVAFLLMNLFSKDITHMNIMVCKEGYYTLKGKDARMALMIWLRSFDGGATYIDVEFGEQIEKSMKNYLTGNYAALLVHTAYFVKNMHRLPTEKLAFLMPIFHDGSEKIDYSIIVHKDSNIDSIKDLKNKQIALEHQLVLGELFLNKEVLESAKTSAKKYTKEINYVKSGMEAILKTYFKQQDVAVVQTSTFDLAVEMNPSLLKHLKILKKSKKIFSPVVFLFNKEVYGKKFADIVEFNRTQEGRNILKVFKISGVEMRELEVLDEFVEYYKEYETLLNKYTEKVNE